MRNRGAIWGSPADLPTTHYFSNRICTKKAIFRADVVARARYLGLTARGAAGERASKILAG
jgi:hypothetical protein